MGAASNTDQREIIQSALRGISHIATLPEITLRIIELAEDPSSTVQDLHNIIQNDPALCSRILKVVNSAFYGLPRQIGSINRAVVLLGLNAVKNIAIAASLTKLFRGGDLCPQFSARDLWTHSIATGAGSKMLCDELRLGLPDEAFLAGLMHDIGIMVQMQAMRKQLVQLFEEMPIGADGTPGANMLEYEQRIFGANHQDFGAGLCESWKFPKSFGYVAGHHHDPLRLPEGSNRLACLVYLADRIAGKLKFGFRSDLPSLEPDRAVFDAIGLTDAQHAKVMEGLPKVYADVEATFA
jgi:HD-like signal output (HDOD) protein